VEVAVFQVENDRHGRIEGVQAGALEVRPSVELEAVLAWFELIFGELAEIAGDRLLELVS